MALIQKSGGIDGFVAFMQREGSLFSSRRGALLVPYFIGIFIFIESSISALIAGAVGKPLCDSHKISHSKLAFVCDSTSAPISSLIVLNGWGALLLGLITTEVQNGLLLGESISLLIESLFYNFYAMSALLVTLLSVWFNIDIGAMKKQSIIHSSRGVEVLRTESMYFMIAPILLMIFSVFFFLYLTGDGDILQGSGSSAVFYTMLTTLFFLFIYYTATKNMTAKTYVVTAFGGAKKLVSIAIILLFAFAIGKLTGELKTGLYLASLATDTLDPLFLGALIFLLSAIISFSTGTSWGTFSIMIPIAIPLALGLESNVALAIGAVISGGVFGDHCSPISDTTIISSLAAECDVVEHVTTQLPYALISAGIALLLFILFGSHLLG
jgi:Na+/H+ antiporter NhaC